MLDEKEKERISLATQGLYLASQKIRILSHLGWHPGIRERFLSDQGKELPKGVEYPHFDAESVLDILATAKRTIDKVSEGAVKEWLLRTEKNIENSARLLSSTARPEFFKYGRHLYGAPKDEVAHGTGTSLSLAKTFNDLFSSLSKINTGAPPAACHLPEAVADRMREAVQVFGDLAPEIEIVDELSANALAGPRRIRIRKNVSFSDLDIEQLVQHEVMVHVATSLNGHEQTHLPILGAGHPGTTKTQEGLAVFAELITGSIDLDRFRRLADRVEAIQLSIEGADFLDVYRFFLERIGHEEQSFENTRRVFRGGVLTGKAPFTKDIVYLDGLLRVHNFLRFIVSAGRSDLIPLLFVGKIDIADVPALAELSVAGICLPPKFLPDWAKDLRFLVCYLAYSAFLNTLDLSRFRGHFQKIIEKTPRLSSGEDV
jgi:uncharacterized protein (TIGR02421 family)